MDRASPAGPVTCHPLGVTPSLSAGRCVVNSGLVDAGISGLRSMPLTHLAFFMTSGVAHGDELGTGRNGVVISASLADDGVGVGDQITLDRSPQRRRGPAR